MIEKNLKVYNSIRLHAGNRVTARPLENIPADIFRAWSVSDLEEYARRRYPTGDLSAVCQGGPRRGAGNRPIRDVYPIPLLQKFITGATDAQTNLADRLIAAEQRVAELEQRARQAPAAAPAEEQGPFEQFLNDVMQNPLGRALVSKVLGVTAGDMAPTPAPGVGAAVGDVAEIPAAVLQYFAAVDWQRADWPKLLQTLQTLNILPLK